MYVQDIWDSGAWLTGAQVIGVGAAIYVAILWIALVLWVARDVKARTMEPWVQLTSVLAVAVFFLPGLLVYLAIRPTEVLSESYNRQLEAEAFLHEIQKQPVCPGCRRMVRDDFNTCPYCRTTLRTACGACGQFLARAWVACPFCSTQREGVRTVEPAAPASRGNGHPRATAERRFGRAIAQPHG